MLVAACIKDIAEWVDVSTGSIEFLVKVVFLQLVNNW